MRSSVAAAGLEWPRHRITVNLAPAGLRKEGSGFDLPIAIAVLAASHQIPRERLHGHAAVGELALDGRVRPVGGVLAAAEGARKGGLERLLCAARSAAEAALAGIEPVPLRHLAEAAAYLRGEGEPPPYEAPNGRPPPVSHPDLEDVRGQERGRRALEIAAAGRHNLLLAGPPGTGKTMLARRLPGLLPGLAPEEALEVTRIHSVVGLLLARAAADRARRLSGAASQRLGRGGRRRRARAASRRGEPRAPRSPVARRAAGVRAARARGAAPAARGRCRQHRPRAGHGALPGALPARGDDEPLPVRRPGRPGGRVLLLHAAPRGLPRQALAGAARPLRPRGHRASTSCARAGGAAGRALRGRCRARLGGPGAARARRRAERRRRTSCSRAPSSGCRSRGAAAPASHVSRSRSRRSRARSPCCRSTSRRRSRTGCRGSSTHERARGRSLRGRDRLTSRRRAALGALCAIRP